MERPISWSLITHRMMCRSFFGNPDGSLRPHQRFGIGNTPILGQLLILTVMVESILRHRSDYLRAGFTMRLCCFAMLVARHSRHRHLHRLQRDAALAYSDCNGRRPHRRRLQQQRPRQRQLQQPHRRLLRRLPVRHPAATPTSTARPTPTARPRVTPRPRPTPVPRP